jgi:hypothetical protein
MRKAISDSSLFAASPSLRSPRMNSGETPQLLDLARRDAVDGEGAKVVPAQRSEAERAQLAGAARTQIHEGKEELIFAARVGEAELRHLAREGLRALKEVVARASSAVKGAVEAHHAGLAHEGEMGLSVLGVEAGQLAEIDAVAVARVAFEWPKLELHRGSCAVAKAELGGPGSRIARIGIRGEGSSGKRAERSDTGKAAATGGQRRHGLLEVKGAAGYFSRSACRYSGVMPCTRRRLRSSMESLPRPAPFISFT